MKGGIPFTMSDLEILAFLDESKKPVRDAETGKVATSGEHYAVAAAIILSGEADKVRFQLRQLLNKVGHDLHYSQLGSRGRVSALTDIATINEWDALIYETSRSVPVQRPERRTRARLLTVAFPELAHRQGVRKITLETRATPVKGFTTLDEHDHATWRSLIDRGLVPPGRVIVHGDKTEPLLWIADLIAGARTDYLCGVDRSMYPLIAHRVTNISVIEC